MNRIFKSIAELVLYVVIIAGLVVGTPKFLVYIMGTEYPIASITSSSMWPVLKKGDLVLIKSVEKSELKVGDVIVYKNSNQEGESENFTIHRIVELNEDNLVTKGDANNVWDMPISYGDVVGRMVEWNGKPVKIPEIGKITIWASGKK